MFEFEPSPIQQRRRDIEPVELTDGTALDLHEARRDLARYATVRERVPFENLPVYEKEVAPLTTAQKIGQYTSLVVELRDEYDLAA